MGKINLTVCQLIALLAEMPPHALIVTQANTASGYASASHVYKDTEDGMDMVIIE
jgi:hypothetical protein